MLPLINQVALAGYTADQILDFLGIHLKDLLPGIKKAKSDGHSAEDILQFLGGKIRTSKSGSEKQLSDNEKYLKGLGYKTADEKAATRSKYIQGAFTLASTAAGAYALTRAVPKAAQALLPQIASQTAPIPQVLRQSLESLLNANPPDVAAEVLKIQQPIIVRDWEKATGRPFLEGVQEFASTYQKGSPTGLPKVQKPPEILKETATLSPTGEKITTQKIKPSYGQIPSEKKLLEEEAIKPEIPSKKLVALKDGTIGDLVNIKKGVAEINEEGRIRRQKITDIIESPLPEKDLGDLYGDLVKAIPESERSAMINIAAYDPENNSLLFRPHNGAYYVYEDIPKEFSEKLKKSMFQAKTTGENFFGAWSKGEASRGAGLYALIKELQALYGGKGKEYSRKYETIHSLLGLAEKSHKEKQDEEKRKKRQRKLS